MVGKIRVSGKIQGGRKKYFQMFCVLSQNFCVPLRNFAFSPQNFAFYRKDISAFPIANFASTRKYFFFLSFAREERKYLCEENGKSLRENAKFLEGTQKFARERKTLKNIFPPTLNFFHSPRIFPTTMSLKGSVGFAL